MESLIERRRASRQQPVTGEPDWVDSGCPFLPIASRTAVGKALNRFQVMLATRPVEQA